LIYEVPENTPAFEYNPDGSYKGILVEPSATNLILQSEDFSDTWSTQGAAVATNTTLAPDGETTADTLTGNGTNTNVHVQQAITFPSAGTYTFSFFAKAGTHDIIRVNIANYDFSTSNITGYELTNNGTTTIPSNPITAVGNGWYRIQFSFEVVSGDLSGQIRIFVPPSAGTTSWSNAADNNGKSVILWGAQLEKSPIATSYIPTEGNQVIRVADDISLTGASSLIGQKNTGGTLFVDVDWRLTTGTTQRLLSASDGTNNNRIQIFNDGGSVELRMLAQANGGSIEMNQGVLSSGFSGIQKFAFAYADADFELYRNGSSISTYTIGSLASLATLTDVNFGANFDGGDQANMWIRAVALYDRRLTNTELAKLTSL